MIGGSTKASVEEIEAGSELALAEAIANINGVDGQSVAGLLDAYLDAAISSRSSHSWDPNARIDAAVSTRSSHGDPDPNGYIDAPISGAGATQADIESGAESALAEDIANYAATAGSVAEILAEINANNDLTRLDAEGQTNTTSELRDPVEAAISNLSPSAGSIAARIDAAISSRSSHQWDPDGVIPSAGTLATQADTDGGGVDWSSKTPKVTTGRGVSDNVLSISGSGFVTGLHVIADDPYESQLDISIDGTQILDWSADASGDIWTQTSTDSFLVLPSSIVRFDSSISIDNPGGYSTSVVITYVLD